MAGARLFASCSRYISQPTQIELDTFHQHAVARVINSMEFLRKAKEDLVLVGGLCWGS